MSKITKSISSKKGSESGQILFRVVVNRSTIYRLKTGIWVERIYWNDKIGDFRIPRDHALAKHPKEIKRRTEELSFKLQEAIDSHSSVPEKKFLESIILSFHGSKYIEEPNSESTRNSNDFFDTFDKFLALNIKRHDRLQQFLVLRRMLLRFQCYRISKIDIDKFTCEDLQIFHDFLSNEHTFFDSEGHCLKKYQYIYSQYPEARISKRGENAIHSILKRLRTFYNWAKRTGECNKNPFATYKLKPCVYGTPIYLTKEERDKLRDYDFSSRPHLGIQRDIFIFQSLIGIRVGDFYRLTESNLVHVEGSPKKFIHYIPSKTLQETGSVVSIPLSADAETILNRYKDLHLPTLLPFISEQKYNKSIKECMRIAGLNRIVTRINPTTGQPEQKELWETASSHMARRNFIGILYSQIKDPDIIASMTGHVEGSKAFARYRNIDNNIKSEIIDLL